jgi:plasmid stabilization system protein ParE
MAHRITISRPAQDDLDAIWDYLAKEASPEIADFVIARLYQAISMAAENPRLYPQSDFRGRPRRVNVFEYAVFYEPEGETSIFVLRIIHGRRHLPKIIGS